MKYVAQNNKIEKCQIATNCILKPKQEILDVLKNPKFSIKISSYDVVNEIKKEDFEKILIENGVKHRFYKYANKTGMWSDTGGIDTPKHSWGGYSLFLLQRNIRKSNSCRRTTYSRRNQMYQVKFG